MSRTPRRPSPPVAPGHPSGIPTATSTSRSRIGNGDGSLGKKRQPATEFCCERTPRATRKVRRFTEWCIVPSSTRRSPAASGSTPWRTRPSPTSRPGDANYTPDNEVTPYSLLPQKTFVIHKNFQKWCTQRVERSKHNFPPRKKKYLRYGWHVIAR